MGFTRRELIQFLDGLVEFASEENKVRAVAAKEKFLSDFEKSYGYEKEAITEVSILPPNHMAAMPNFMREEIRQKVTAALTEHGGCTPENVDRRAAYVSRFFVEWKGGPDFMMGYEIFKEAVKRSFLSCMPISYQGMEVRVVPVEKVNRRLDGLSLLLNDGKTMISPTIYINDMYEQYIKTGDLQATMQNAAEAMDQAFREATVPMPDINTAMVCGQAG